LILVDVPTEGFKDDSKSSSSTVLRFSYPIGLGRRDPHQRQFRSSEAIEFDLSVREESLRWKFEEVGA